MVAVFIQPRCRNRPVDRGGRRGLCTCCPPIAQRMGRTSRRFRRLDCGHCRRRILVCSTSIFPRRYFMRRGILLGALLAIFVLSITLAGLQAPQGPRRGGGAPEGQRRGAPAPQPRAIQKVKDNLYMITGEGGNTAVFVTDKAVTIVDTKNP